MFSIRRGGGVFVKVFVENFFDGLFVCVCVFVCLCVYPICYLDISSTLERYGRSQIQGHSLGIVVVALIL